jgi:hypothetical protein
MSRLTGSEIAKLMEAYSAVYAPEEEKELEHVEGEKIEEVAGALVKGALAAGGLWAAGKGMEAMKKSVDAKIDSARKNTKIGGDRRVPQMNSYEPKGKQVDETMMSANRAKQLSQQGGSNTGSSTIPSPSGSSLSGPLGSLNTAARGTVTQVGGAIGRNQASKMPGANMPIIGGAIKREGERRGQEKAGQMYDKVTSPLSSVLKQSYEPDNFDYILEYLVSEGYADTNKAALVIMANMSEEWRKSIVEADSIEAMKARAAKRRKQRYGASDTSRGGRDDFRPYTEDDYKRPGPGSQAKEA